MRRLSSYQGRRYTSRCRCMETQSRCGAVRVSVRRNTATAIERFDDHPTSENLLLHARLLSFGIAEISILGQDQIRTACLFVCAYAVVLMVVMQVKSERQDVEKKNVRHQKCAGR